MVSLKGKRILLTGGAGFLGRHLQKEFQKQQPAEITIPRSNECDLRVAENVKRLLKDSRPDFIVHLAAKVGGIGANRQNPGSFFYDTIAMGINIIEQARLAQVDKLVCVGSSCSYPKHTPIPFREEDLWNGYPEETNAPYGIAKRALLAQCIAYRQQYGMNAIYLIPSNLYGPGDNSDPEDSHVIPALIRKCILAKQRGDRTLTVWGTGNATRDFLYVQDCVRAIVAGTLHYNRSQPINIGSGHEISIKNLVDVIASFTGFEGKIVWDSSKPDGQPQRRLDTSRAFENFGWKAKIGFEQGLRETVNWFEGRSL